MEQKFDKEFIISQIFDAKEKLNKGNLSVKEKTNLEIMVDEFTKYLEKRVSSNEVNNECIFDKKGYKKINDKLKKDLDLIDINLWRKILYIYDNIDRSYIEEKNYNNITMKQEDVFNIILNFYRSIDEEYYNKALQIIQCPRSLINFDNNLAIGDQCFTCEALKAPFINITSINDEKYVAFIHEMQHGIDYLVKGSCLTGLLSELSPMFFENLFIDFLNEKNNCAGLYNFRLNRTVNLLDWLNSYTKILLKFEKYGRKITKYNIKKIFGVKSNDELKHKYQKYMKVNFIECWGYMLSFLICIKLKNDYYNGYEKEVINSLKDSLNGKYMSINFDELINNYNNFVAEIKEKQKTYQKTVNL